MSGRSLWPPTGANGPGRHSETLSPSSIGGAGQFIAASPTLPRSRSGSGIDDAAVRAAVTSINRRLDDQITAETTPEQARELIAAEVRAWIGEQAGSGAYTLTAELEARLVAAVHNERFGLGALQPLLEDPDIETIDVNGAHQVWITYADGHKVQGEPVADTNDHLAELIRRWGAYQGQSARDFSPAKPKLRLALPDGSRLTALMSVTPWPCLSIRRHRMIDCDLDELMNYGTLDPGLREFLRAAVRARKNIVVTGGMSAGKTTFARALAADFPREERLVTVEGEYELYLHTLPHRHADVVPLEAREPNAEGVGGIGVRELVTDALRLNAKRIIVGEVLGDELVPMLTAMNTGGEGSVCTIHANSAAELFGRMLILANSGGLSFPPATLFRLAGMAVDFVVHLRHEVRYQAGRPINWRFVSEVAEVLPPTDTEEPATNAVYVPGPDGRALPRTLPQCARDLERVGFDTSHFTMEMRNT